MAIFNQDRKQEVFQKTLNLLSIKDYSRVTMLDIAKEAKISKETLYKNFGNKIGLFEAIIQENSSIIKEKIEQALENKESSVQQVLSNVVYLYLSTIISPGSALINRIAIAEVNQNPELASILIENGRGNVYPSMCKYIEELQKQELVSDDQHSERMVEILFGLAAGDTQIRYLLKDLPQTPDEAFLKDRAEKAVEYFFRIFGRFHT